MCVFVLIDVRHTPQEIDMEFMEKLSVKGIPFVMVFTKADKLKPETLASNVEKYNAKMLENWEVFHKNSSAPQPKSQGRVEIFDFIDETNKLFQRPY